MMKRIGALMLALVLCLTLFAGCGGNDAGGDTANDVTPSPAVIDYDAAFAKYDPETVVMTVDGSEVTWSEFFYMLYSSLSQIEYYMGGIYWDELCINDLTYDQYTMEMTATMLKQLHAVEREAAELGIKLTKDDMALIDDNKQNVMAQYCGEDATEEDLEAFLLSELYLTVDGFEFINRNSVLYEKLFQETVGEGGEKITDAEINAYIDAMPYVTAKHILLMTIDPDTNEPLTEEEIANAKATAEDLLATLQAIEDDKERAETFDKLMHEYSEDTGLSIFPDGYTFTTGEMYAEFEAAAFALEEYQVSEIVESQAGYHILMRLPTTKDSSVDLDYQTGTYYTILAYAATEVYSQRLADWMDECEVVWMDEFKDLTAKQLFA